jgi:hypothetical protein
MHAVKTKYWTVFASQGTPSVIRVGHGRIPNTGHPGSSKYHQTDDFTERAFCTIHDPEPGQGTSFDGKSDHLSYPLRVLFKKFID